MIEIHVNNELQYVGDVEDSLLIMAEYDENGIKYEIM